MEKKCDCEKPYFYAPVIKGGECRFCHKVCSKQSRQKV